MAIKYVPFYPDTVQGQAILNNIARTRRVLKYRDNDKVIERIQRGMPYYELELLEQVRPKKTNGLFKNEEKSTGSSGISDMLIRGECISACAYLKDKGIKVDLVYIDPPFASGADYAKKVYLRKNPKLAETITKAEEEMDLEELRAFEEKMYGDIWNKEDYLNWMYENLTAIKSVMSETAGIYVHLDWHIGHYVKILMDEVFGEDNFINEIVWRKLTAAKSQSLYFSNIKDSLFLYKIGDSSIFNPVYIETDENDTSYPYTEEIAGQKRKYGSFDFTQKGAGPARCFGDKILEPPPGKHWIWSQEKIDEGLKDGRIIFTSNGTPRLKRYLDEKEGNYVGDLWIDDGVAPLSSNNQERTDVDYSTQKPEALLERIIKASSDEGMIVADFFGGSGVTAKVAHDLKRTFIHCDVGINSIQTTRDRLKDAGADFDIYDVQDGVSLFRNPAQTMDKLKTLVTGLKNEDSLDSFWEGAITDSKLGLIPVYIPNLLDHSTKVLDIPLMNRILNEAMPELPDGIKKVIVYYIDIEDRKELEDFIRDYNDTEAKIELRDLKTLLDDIVINDEAEYTLKQTGSNYEIEFNTFVSDRLNQKIDAYNKKKELNLLNGTDQDIFEQNDPGDEYNGDDEGGNGNGDGNKAKKPFKPIEISENGLELIEMVSLDCTNTEGAWKSDYELKIDKNGYMIRNSEKTKQYWNGKIISGKKPLRMKLRNIAGDESIFSIEEK